MCLRYNIINKKPDKSDEKVQATAGQDIGHILKMVLDKDKRVFETQNLLRHVNINREFTTKR